MSVDTIAQRWEGVVERVSKTAIDCGRNPEEILIIGVTKYVDNLQTRRLYEAGCRDFGESRPQALWEKSQSLSDLSIRWHLIGHLQRNKSRRTIPIVHCIHSVDSLRLAQQLESDANEIDKYLSILLEVNVSGDTNKTGVSPTEIPRLANEILEMPHLRIIGLMGMAGLGKQAPQHDFAAIRQLRDQLQVALGSAARLEELSMGMSGDFEAAIREGATMIRIGSILFPDS